MGKAGNLVALAVTRYDHNWCLPPKGGSGPRENFIHAGLALMVSNFDLVVFDHIYV